MKEFILKEGVSIEHTQGVCEGYSLTDGENLLASVSFDKLKSLTEKILDVMASPIFFFAEVPCTEDEEKSLGDGFHKNIYYLDNCTKDVCRAIIKRYGDILFADGLIQFGFGAHKDNSEIFHQKYQVASVYSPKISEFQKAFEKVGISETDQLVTIWDVISEKNPAESLIVEANGETIYDMIENLKSAGLYLGETVEDN